MFLTDRIPVASFGQLKCSRYWIDTFPDFTSDKSSFTYNRDRDGLPVIFSSSLV